MSLDTPDTPPAQVTIPSTALPATPLATPLAPTVSLIVATYNWPQALHWVLQSVIRQRRLPDEVIIADDGSGEETAALIRRHQASFPVPLIHAWQADQGFRLSRSRNNAVAQSQGEYLIFIDGDTVLHRDFVADHRQLASVGRFAVGSRVLMREAATHAFFAAADGGFSLWKAVASNAASNKVNALHCPQLAAWYAKPVREPIDHWIFKVRGCNMAVWRSDYEAVNGFNQAFSGWGREDSEFALRLFKKGLSMRRLKFAAIQYHLYHRENDRRQRDKNDAILAQALAEEGYRCTDGLTGTTLR